MHTGWISSCATFRKKIRLQDYRLKKYLQGRGLELPKEVQPHLAAAFIHGRVTSVDDECFFSAYKRIMTDKRDTFTPANTENLCDIVHDKL
jgi:hypothetical protein